MGDVETLKIKIVGQCRGDIEVPAFIADVDALVAAVRAEEEPAGRCQDCGKHERMRVNHPSGALCYTCVRARIFTESAPGSALDAAEYLFAVLANVSGGDWSQQSPEWREAAARARDLYHAALNKAHPPVAKPCAVAGCDQPAVKELRLGQYDMALVCLAHYEVAHALPSLIDQPPSLKPWSPTAGRFRSGISDG